MTHPDGSTGLIRYNEARRALQAASRVDEAKDIKDKAVALKTYALQKRNPEMYRWIAEIELRARRRIGELSRELEKATGDNLSNVAASRQSRKSKRAALKAAGIGKDEAHRCERIASVPPEVFERVISEKNDALEAITADAIMRYVVKREKQALPRERAHIDSQRCCQVQDLETLASTPVRFGTVYADPAWQYGNQATRASTGDHYIGMTVDEICALPIAAISAPDAHLHLWTTNAFLFDAKRVIEAWGFEYKSCFIWVKPQMGMGNYWRVSHEFLLFGVRGSAPFADRSLMSWGEFPRRQHSAKPEEIRALIERASPGPRLELFARRQTPGWYVWGNEIERAVFDAALEIA